MAVDCSFDSCIKYEGRKQFHRMLTLALHSIAICTPRVLYISMASTWNDSSTSAFYTNRHWIWVFHQTAHVYSRREKITHKATKKEKKICFSIEWRDSSKGENVQLAILYGLSFDWSSADKILIANNFTSIKANGCDIIVQNFKT